MTTRRQIKTLFAAVCQRWPEFQVVGNRTLILKPVGQLVRGVIMDRTSIADLPNQEWFIGFTCNPTCWLNSAWGRFQPGDFATKYWSHAHQQEAFLGTIENEVLPLLKSVDSVAGLMGFRHPQEARWRYSLEGGLNRLALHAAIGRFDVVDEEARRIVAAGHRRTPWWTEETYVEVIEQLWPLTLADDRPAVAALLHDWERRFVESNGMRDIYEKMPFPFEQPPTP